MIHIEYQPSLVTLRTPEDCRVVDPPGVLVEAQPPVERLLAPLALPREGLPGQKLAPVNLLGRGLPLDRLIVILLLLSLNLNTANVPCTDFIKL